MLKIVCVLLLISLVSCTKQKKEYGLGTVSLDNSDAISLVINKNANTSYGPDVDLSDENSKEVAPREVILSLNLYSTLYQSVAVIDLLKRLEKEGINISILGGNGFASLLLALYAKEKSITYLEWKLFDLQKNLIDLIPYSPDWRSYLENFLQTEFGELRLSDLKTLLLIPIIKNDEVTFNDSAKVRKIVLESMTVENRKNILFSPEDFTMLFQKYSSDIHINMTYLSSNPKILKLDGFRWGVLTKYLGRLKQIESNNILDSKDQLYLDKLISVSDIQKSFEQSNKNFVEKLKLKLDEWSQKNSTSSN